MSSKSESKRKEKEKEKKSEKETLKTEPQLSEGKKKKIVYKKIVVDFWATGLHGEEIGIRQLEQHRAKSRQFSKDLDIYGSIIEDGNKVGFVGWRTEAWESGIDEEPEEEGEEPASVEISCDEFASDQHISQELEVDAGDSFTVALCSNQTTGFQWSESAQIDDETIAEQTNHIFISPEEQQIVGAAGQEVWTFQALQQGTTTVKMEYSQPWEGGTKAEWTFTLTLVVE